MHILLKIFIPIVLLLTALDSYAGPYKVLKKQNDVTISYKSKLNKETGEQEVYLKLLNKSGTSQTIDLEIGFYDNGILQSSSTITSCLKSGILPQIHSITDNEMAKQLDSSIKIEVTSLTITPIDECRETDRE